MNERKVTSEELVKALRCAATPIPKDTDLMELCKGCPYDHTEKPEKFEMFLAEKDGLVHCCDADRMSMDAAARIEELEKRLVKALCNMHAMAEGVDHCFMCKHDNHADVDSYCQGCDGENFEWKE